MGDFTYFDIFATKGTDYLIAIICVLSLIVFWMWLRKSDKSETKSSGWGSSIAAVVAVCAVLLVIVLGYQIVVGIQSAGAKTMDAGLEKLPVYGFDLSTVRDGTFRGESKFGSFVCTVDVTVKNHTIKGIEIVDNPKAQASPEGQSIIKQVLDEQTPYISAVSGATISTKTFLRAIENALVNAL